MRFVNCLLILSCAALAVTACSPGLESGRGLVLPEGDPELGKQAFIKLQCHACHTIAEVELPDINIDAPVSVPLGAATSDITTYEQLVTSIVNPSHKLNEGYPTYEVSAGGASFMPSMNDFMTVRELVDMVAFLQEQYAVTSPKPAPYAIYRYD